VSDVLAAFTQGRRVAGDGWTAQCPAHDDARNSLSIGRGADGCWLLKCHAGCSLDAILTAAHLNKSDLFPSKATNGRDLVATFDYRDEHGELLYQVCRFAPKEFRQRAADGSWSVKGVRRVLYRLPELQGRRKMFVTEGEKDADCLWSMGLPATTNAGGAGKWRAEYADMLKRAGCQHVVVLPDNDAPGETHGRDVARSCVEAQLEVKLIPLPGLPRKGDVSDFLQQHSKDELLAIVKDAPLFTPQRPVAAVQPITLTSIADFLDEPDDRVDWVVEDRIPAGGVVLFPAPPKAGKSTASRELAFAVSRGEPWLGWKTTAGAVWLLVFEDKRSEVRKHLRRLGASGSDAIRLFVDQAPADLWPQLHELADKERPALIVVDTLARALKVKDFNDYAMVTQAFEPLLNLTRATGATLLLLHHSSVHVSREGLDAVLGSTALSGSVDNILILKRTDQQRVLSSVQRIGPDLEPTVIVLNADTGRLERGGRKCDVDDADLGQRIVGALRTTTEPVTEDWIQKQVGGRKTDEVRVLRRLIGVGHVAKVSGAGKKGDPWRYALAENAVPEGGNRIPNSAKFEAAPEQHKPQISQETLRFFDRPDATGPNGSLYSQNAGTESNSNHSRTSEDQVFLRGIRRSTDSVPEPSQNSGNGASGTEKTPDEHCSEFGSRGSDIERL
jgi:putative DNA primase/helicase